MRTESKPGQGEGSITAAEGADTPTVEARMGRRDPVEVATTEDIVRLHLTMLRLLTELEEAEEGMADPGKVDQVMVDMAEPEVAAGGHTDRPHHLVELDHMVADMADRLHHPSTRITVSKCRLLLAVQWLISLRYRLRRWLQSSAPKLQRTVQRPTAELRCSSTKLQWRLRRVWLRISTARIKTAPRREGRIWRLWSWRSAASRWRQWRKGRWASALVKLEIRDDNFTSLCSCVVLGVVSLGQP